jgi:hypothetical protein
MKIKVATFAAMALALAVSATGDGFPIKDGRYQGKTTVLRLTSGQIASLAASRQLKLTTAQKSRLKAATGAGPSEIHVYFTKDGENDHTCMAYNVGFRFSESEIEVPHEYVVNDQEAAKRAKEMEGM